MRLPEGCIFLLTRLNRWELERFCISNSKPVSPRRGPMTAASGSLFKRTKVYPRVILTENCRAERALRYAKEPR